MNVPGWHNLINKMSIIFFSQEPPSDCCAAICRAMIKDEEDWKIGKNKIFLRVPQA